MLGPAPARRYGARRWPTRPAGDLNCRKKEHRCAENSPELRDRIGHDALGHQIAGSLIRNGYTTGDTVGRASLSAIEDCQSISVKGLERLAAHGLINPTKDPGQELIDALARKKPLYEQDARRLVESYRQYVLDAVSPSDRP
ncbi:hypothetical protein SSPIM334S_06909 [Streptomyces spiroverticillatus]|nr:hypothetical protein [Streptomyces finlayi]